MAFQSWYWRQPRFLTFLFLTAGLALSQPEFASADPADPSSAQNSSVTGGSVNNSAIANDINNQDLAELVAMAKTFADETAASAETRVEVEKKAAELASTWGFTSSAVTTFFRIMGEQNVRVEEVRLRLV